MIKTKNKTDVKEIIINKVIHLIEDKKTIPWVKPWYIPESMNLISGHKYQGINIFITSFADSPYFIGRADIKKYGMIPKKGSHAYPIVYYKPLIYMNGKKLNEDTYKSMNKAQQEKCKYIPLLRYYNVFNIEDINQDTMPDIIKKRIKKYSPDNNHVPKIDYAENLIKKHNPTIKTGGNRAYYIPVDDYIKVPEMNSFKNSNSYYCTLFHEIAHWTGHASRLKRTGIIDTAKFGDHKYSIEELVAELTAGQLCHNMEIEFNIDNSTAYIANWLKALKNDPDMLFTASKYADRAIEYLTK